MPQLFTLDEATALLPRLRKILPELQDKKHTLDVLRGELEEMGRAAAGNGHLLAGDLNRKRREAQVLAERLNKLVDELNDMGCELKGVDEGLIDFTAQREQRTVYLCWKLGEDRIEYWHELDTGFAGRQPL
jgi:hypothetical protein